MNVGERVAEILRLVGVDVVFGVPGGQTLPLYRATRDRGMTHVVTRDERNAACAADAYARVAGRIGVCDATVGPGVTNLVSGLAEAFASSIPVLAIVADIRTDQQHLRRRSIVSQATEQGALLAPVTKWVASLPQARALDDTMDHALRVATTGRPGPVVLEIPEDIWLEEVAPSRTFRPEDAVAPRHRGEPPAETLDRAAAALEGAARPVILAGGGVVTSGAATELRRLASERNLPVVTTINGKGAVDEHDPIAGGVVGLFGDARAAQVLDGADVILVVGSKLDQFSTHGWRIPHADQHVIHVDIDGEELGRTGPCDVAVVADARATLGALSKRLGVAAGPSAVGPVSEPDPLPIPRDGRLHPAEVCRVLDERLVADDVVVCDASYASGWGATHLRISRPRHFVAPRGLAGIGWSPGAAIGARLAAEPGGRVLVLAGDGGFAYGVGEIETAARLGLDIVYVVLNNSALAWIAHGEERMGMAPGSTFSDVDFATVARGFGGDGCRAATLDEVGPGIDEALTRSGPFVLDVATSADVAPIVSLREVRGRTSGAAVKP